MRISPLGIALAGADPSEVFEAAAQDAGLTHPHRICRDASGIFAAAIAGREGPASGGPLWNWSTS
jgi:ADP-ribosyl-[dinitrogen reductase] hydrolase